MTVQNKKRNPFIAVFLSLLAPGAGQIYNGRGALGIVLLAVPVALPVLWGWAGWARRFSGFVAFILAGVAVWLFAIVHAFIQARRAKETGLKRYQRTVVYALVVIVSIGSAVLLFGTRRTLASVSPYRIVSPSMMPAIQTGDLLMTDPKAYAGHGPQRGDLVVFVYPRDPAKQFVDRVIALEGETIEIKDKQVFVAGQPLQEPYKIHQDSGLDSERDSFGPFTVPAGHCFVLGDNRDNSLDGRYWGALPLANLRGKALYVYWAKDKKRIGLALK
ncbi:MAG: signal peptidase I [Candidatus Aminicenantes bacterium]|nr:signal peptidase I [Candidatus Aminicenantes bacterium]